LRLRALEHGKPTCETFDGSSKPSLLMANADLHETPSVKTRFPSGRTSTSSRETSLD